MIDMILLMAFFIGLLIIGALPFICDIAEKHESIAEKHKTQKISHEQLGNSIVDKVVKIEARDPETGEVVWTMTPIEDSKDGRDRPDQV